jgi:hypothetical protein
MRDNGASERHQNNALKAVIGYAKYVVTTVPVARVEEIGSAYWLIARIVVTKIYMNFFQIVLQYC